LEEFQVVEPASKKSVSELIQWHLDRSPKLPKPVQDLSEEEFAIFEIAAFHVGFLLFLRDRFEEVAATPPRPI
jgi:hypothetical protein